jgi:predicted nucleic acid-binding protein
VIVVDSSVWIDYFNGVATTEAERLDMYLDTDVILVGDLVLTEVLQGFRADRDHQAVRAALTRLVIVSMVGAELAIKSADNFGLLRRRGVTVRKTIDCLIATFCIDGGHRLLFSDRDFDPFVEHLGLLTA